MKFRLRLVLCAVVMLATLAPVAFAADWNQWRGPNRDGVATDSPQLIDKLPDDGLTPKWVSDEEIPSARDGGWAVPVVVGNRVFVYAHQRTKVATAELPKSKYPYLPPEKRTGMSEAEFEQYEQHRREENFQRAKAYQFHDVVYCLDADSGKTLWKYSSPSVYTRWPQSGTPVAQDDKFYVVGGGRRVFCLETHQGKELWATQLPGKFTDEFYQSSPVVVEGAIVALGGYLYGVDAATGQVLWTGDEKSTSGVHCSPVVWNSAAGPRVVVNVEGRETLCVEPKTGREAWRIRSEAQHATPIVIGDRLYTFGSSRKSGLRCFQMGPTGAELLWTYRGVADPGSTPVAVGGHLYVQGEKRLACVELESGQQAWMTLLDMANPRYASLVAADDKVFYAWQGLLVFAADPGAYRPLVNARFDSAALMGEETFFRDRLKMDELEKSAEGQQQAERLWRDAIDKHGPLRCITPTLANGRLYLRMESRVVCYDLRK